MVEYWVGVALVSAIVAILIGRFLEPRPVVGFSDCILAAVTAPGLHAITFRLARQSSTLLINCKVSVSVTLVEWDAGRTKIVGGASHSLELVNDSCPVFTHFRVKHVVDESSPLYNDGHSLNTENIWGVTVLVDVWDTVYMKDARLFHMYKASDFVNEAEFVDLAVDGDGNGGMTINHSALSTYRSTTCRHATHI